MKHASKEEKIKYLEQIRKTPQNYLEVEHWNKLAEKIMEEFYAEPEIKVNTLRHEPLHFNVLGQNLVDEQTIIQMQQVMTLPLEMRGALLPDAHVGYGFPIGSVVAAKNKVIPYGVGVDIGCSMSLSVFDAGPEFLEKHDFSLKQSLIDHTHFGQGGWKTQKYEHAILDDSRFEESPLLKKRKGKAALQLGTSGSGNHFVEWGLIEFPEDYRGIPPGKYLALFSHSGSRGLGADIANHYLELAMQECRLPNKLERLAWLDTSGDEGMEYWTAMELAIDFAKACHESLHLKLKNLFGFNTLLHFTEAHNQAQKENLEGGEWVVHRKGANQVRRASPLIIPGSMKDRAYLVEGIPEDVFLNSLAHGSGRKLSRQKASLSTTRSEILKQLKKEQITLIEGSLDENPFAYKSIEEVMKAQSAFCHTKGIFLPKIIRMDKH
jgi:tRNA-splicing ligase RtcB